jgi:iron complex outermembrane receptor protein
MNWSTKALTGAAALGAMIAIDAAPAFAQLDEIVVEARKKEESLQDVPVTVAAFDEAHIDTYQIDTFAEIADFVPNMRVQNGGSGSGGTIILRGVSTSAISAAFDSAVSFNIDGIQSNTMRLVNSSFLDMAAVEVLKGPQALYFGKSSSAGVVSIRSGDPTEEFMAKGLVSYEFEEKGVVTEGVVAGPITDTIGGRYAIKFMNRDEIMKMEPDTVNGAKDRGEKTLDMRATLTWDPTDSWSSNLKGMWSQYENDGAILFSDQLCQGTSPQDRLYGGGMVLPGFYDCNAFDQLYHFGNQNAVEAANIPDNRGGVPFEEQDVILISLASTWDLDVMGRDATVSFVSGYYDLDNSQNDCFGYGSNGIGCNLADNTTKSWSQEVRYESSVNDNIDFLAGAYFQKRYINFKPWQHAAGISLVAPDPITGFTSDYRKEHRTENETYSLFGSVSVRPVERLEMSGGLRYTREEKANRIDLPYMHLFLQLGGFLPSGFAATGLKFADDNLSPEFTGTYKLVDGDGDDHTFLGGLGIFDDLNVYAAYKTGFKSGGIDNSALPTSSLGAAAVSGDFSSLIFKSETAKGWEAGIKSQMFDNTVRLNVSYFNYDYKDLQVQTFDAIAIQFTTSNANSMKTEGAELDMLWATPLEGLDLRGALAWTDARLTDDFTAPGFMSLAGTRLVGSSEWSGNIGGTYEYQIPNTELVLGAAGTAHFTSDYLTGNPATSMKQDNFWRGDVVASLGDIEGMWKLALIAQNVTDKIYTVTQGPIPFSDPTSGGTTNGQQDQILQQNRGRMLSIELSAAF